MLDGNCLAARLLKCFMPPFHLEMIRTDTFCLCAKCRFLKRCISSGVVDARYPCGNAATIRIFILIDAARRGDVEHVISILKDIEVNRMEPQRYIDIAVLMTQVTSQPVLEILAKINNTGYYQLILNAIEMDNKTVVEFALSKSPHMHFTYVESAMYRGTMDMLQFILERYLGEPDENKVTLMAIETEDLERLRLAVNMGYVLPVAMPNIPVKEELIPMLLFLAEFCTSRMWFRPLQSWFEYMQKTSHPIAHQLIGLGNVYTETDSFVATHEVSPFTRYLADLLNAYDDKIHPYDGPRWEFDS